MGDFRVYANTASTSETYPYLLDVQSELLSALETRLVIPLVRSQVYAGRPIRNLNPVVSVEGMDCLALTQQMSAVPRSLLGVRIEGVDISRTEVLGAIDFLVTGI